MDANELKAFFAAVRKDIDKVCMVASPGSFHLNGKACGFEACPYNGFCEAAQKVSDSLIDYVCRNPELHVSTTETDLFATREEFEELKDAVSKLRKDLASLDNRTASARRYAASHERKYK